MKKKYYQILFLKDLKKSENIFIFQNRKNLKIFDFVFWKFEISKSEISKSEKYFLKMENIPKPKIKKIRFFDFGKLKYFLNFFKSFKNKI